MIVINLNFLVMSSLCYYSVFTGQVLSPNNNSLCRRVNSREPLKKLHNLLQWLNDMKNNCRGAGENVTEENTTRSAPLQNITTPIYNKVSEHRIHLPQNNCSQISVTSKLIQGYFILICGRKYFFSLDMVYNITSAEEICCALDMQLAIIESVDNLFCLSRYFAQTLKMKDAIMWTSGRRSPRNQFGVWPDNNTILETVHTPPSPLLGLTRVKQTFNTCMTVLLATERVALSGVRYSNCSAQYRVLCQRDDPRASSTAPPTTELPTCETPSCPKLDCEVTFSEAQSACCKINATAVSLYTESVSACLRRFLLEKAPQRNDSTVLAWTSGTCQDCKKKWLWCDTTRSMLPAKPVMWASFQPDNRHDHERCIAIGKILTMNGLHDVDCDNSLPVICGPPRD